jgi:predicted small secreted protein
MDKQRTLTTLCGLWVDLPVVKQVLERLRHCFSAFPNISIHFCTLFCLSSALLAACGSPFGIGSDIGGSIRMPAFFNGIFGHKPTFGLVPNNGQFPDAQGNLTKFLVTGPMCRFTEDLIPMFKVCLTMTTPAFF